MNVNRTLLIAKYCHVAMLGAVVSVIYYIAPHHRKTASLLGIVCVAVAFGAGYVVATYEPFTRQKSKTSKQERGHAQ